MLNFKNNTCFKTAKQYSEGVLETSPLLSIVSKYPSEFSPEDLFGDFTSLTKDTLLKEFGPPVIKKLNCEGKPSIHLLDCTINNKQAQILLFCMSKASLRGTLFEVVKNDNLTVDELVDLTKTTIKQLNSIEHKQHNKTTSNLIEL